MKLFLTFPGAKLKVEQDSSCFNGADSAKWCNAHVFDDNVLRTTWGKNHIDDLRYKDLTPFEIVYLMKKIQNAQHNV